MLIRRKRVKQTVTGSFGSTRADGCWEYHWQPGGEIFLNLLLKKTEVFKCLFTCRSETKICSIFRTYDDMEWRRKINDKRNDWRVQEQRKFSGRREYSPLHLTGYMYCCVWYCLWMKPKILCHSEATHVLLVVIWFVNIKKLLMWLRSNTYIAECRMVFEWKRRFWRDSVEAYRDISVCTQCLQPAKTKNKVIKMKAYTN